MQRLSLGKRGTSTGSNPFFLSPPLRGLLLGKATLVFRGEIGRRWGQSFSDEVAQSFTVQDANACDQECCVVGD